MKNYVSKILCLLSTGVLLGACNNSGGSKTKEQYFKYVAEALEDPVPDEVYATFYDGSENRFYIDLVYDEHFNLSLKVVEYDLWDFTFYPNEGEVSDDYESITLEYTAFEKSELFSRGTYVLSHSVKSGKDVFNLDAAGKNYPLTLTKKENPHYIDRDLVGEFEYQSGGNTLFSMKVEVGEKTEGYPVTISLEEEDKTFTGSNIRNVDVTTTFDINGTADGTYLNRSKDAVLSYNEGYEIYQLKIGTTNYPLTKTKGYDGGEEEKDNYFFVNAGLIKLSCDDFEVRVASAGGEMVQLIFKELVEGGNQNFWCWFELGNDDSITNLQTFSEKNVIFTKDLTCTFKHHRDAEVDIVDLYFDGVLAYQNLTITEISE